MRGDLQNLTVGHVVWIGTVVFSKTGKRKTIVMIPGQGILRLKFISKRKKRPLPPGNNDCIRTSTRLYLFRIGKIL